ncbi:MAG: NAD(P)(+) transhydrogenase (Re/Si-specific) subunit beta [Candidatus Eisenbacteria bacterium]|uniref:NAD(P) transhydrogenase subunit beta n=1 Tax=Eiseniibacteriota bacterium TaxID=2212470 RepID=A0A7Y2EA17_UNCEI|nr:NAD(P)(+) transhydrogenase (Re/Si-specific) subunit beta [Candidatus Eisenbacteria bacterium]
MKGILVQLIYMASAIFFIYGLKLLSHVRTARKGNTLASSAMLVAIVVTLLEIPGFDPLWIFAGILIGGGIGAFAAKKVAMTDMPQMVAIFNGFGGGASALVALSFFWKYGVGAESGTLADNIGVAGTVSAILSIVIGSVTLSGSGIAFAKLQGLMTGNPILFKGQNQLNLLIALGMVAVGGWVGFVATGSTAVMVGALVLTLITLIIGITTVIPIGGADMPVVIALLNSYSGLAACAAGFVVENNLLIIAGSLVGASGLILTNIMCKAMNRSLGNVLFGGFGGETAGAANNRDYNNIKQYGAEDGAMVMDTAESVIIVPGYGLAVAQAQHACKELGDLLEKRGATVKYAIHPVAGRMPGHMNVLLAEADVPYEQLLEMDDINPEFKRTDVVLILGANDVVNPAALDDPASPIYGMPILNVHEARSVMVVKRSLSPGFAGIKNELFDFDNTLMIFGDAKKILQELVSEVRNN